MCLLYSYKRTSVTGTEVRKAKLLQQMAGLTYADEMEVATRQSDKERLMRDKLSAESEVEKLAQVCMYVFIYISRHKDRACDIYINLYIYT